MIEVPIGDLGLGMLGGSAAPLPLCERVGPRWGLWVSMAHRCSVVGAFGLCVMV